MKSKFTKILGVGLTVAVLASLMVASIPGSPASAGVGTLQFENIPLPKFGALGSFVLAPGTDVGPIAVAPDGKVMFAAASLGDAGMMYYSVTTATANATLALSLTYLDQDYNSSTTTVNIAAGLTVGTTGDIPLAAGDTGVYDVTAVTQTGTLVAAVGAVDIFSDDGCDFGNYADALDTSTTGVFTDGAMVTAAYPIATLLKSGDGGLTFTRQASFGTCIVDIVVSPQYATDGTVFVATEEYVYQSIDGGVTFNALGAGWDIATEYITDFDIALDRTGRLAIIVGTSNLTGGGGDVYCYVPATTGLTWKQQLVDGSASKTFDVLAVAFSPKFASDEGIFAVVDDPTAGDWGGTKFRSAFGRTATGGGWAAAIGDATFRDLRNDPFWSDRARIAFPSDFNIGSLGTNIAFVGLSALNYDEDEDDYVEMGDVYKVTLQSTVSAATDLNIRGVPTALSATATSIWSIAVSGTAAAANVMVGTGNWTVADEMGVACWTAYYSTDSGATWGNAREKSPTGGDLEFDAFGVNSEGWYAETYVVIAPDFATSKTAWAGTSGVETSALSRTKDGGKSWNQISLIDYANTTANYTVSSMKADATYSKTQTLWIFTKVGTTRGALWKSINGGLNYERFFSFANPTATNTLYSFSLLTDSLWVYDSTLGKFWRSSDVGVSWPTVIMAHDAGISGTTIRDANTIWTFSGGSIWSTTNAGLTWVKPDESILVTAPSYGFSFSGNNVIVPSGGEVYISTDAGKTFKSKLGITPPGAGGIYLCGFDPAYATNKFVYANVSYGTANGVYRIAVNEALPTSTLWKRIDANPTYAPGYGTVNPVVGFDLLGVYYVWDYATVDAAANTGGIWRSVNPRDDPDGLYPPQWEKFRRGLPDGTALNYAGYAVAPNTIFGFLKSGTTTVPYYNQLVAMADTLSSAVTLSSPADKATGVGTSATTESLYLNVTLAWTAMTGATIYHVQVATDAAFVSMVTEFSSSATKQEIIGTFLSGNVYYWRVRVGNYATGVTAGAPLISPWAVARSFTVGVPFALQLKIVSPATGAMDVPVLPTFVWTVLPGVTTYELVVSEDPTFAIIDWSRTSDKAYFQADESLAYSTTYYWRVRQTGGTWVNGIFTTQAEPTTPPPPFTFTQPPETTITVVPGPTTEAVPGYLLWIIIAIGAVLVIALIVLIIRTRRSA